MTRVPYHFRGGSIILIFPTRDQYQEFPGGDFHRNTWTGFNEALCIILIFYFLGTVVFIPIIVVVVGSVVCYLTVLKTIKRAEARHESAVYKEGATYIKQVLIWFLLTNIPLGICGLVLLIYAFNLREKTRDNKIIQQIYVFCLAITAIDAIINPYYLLKKHSDLNAYVVKKVESFKSSLRSQQNRRCRDEQCRDENVDIMNDLTYSTFQQTTLVTSVNNGFEGDGDGGESTTKRNGNTPHGTESQ